LSLSLKSRLTPWRGAVAGEEQRGPREESGLAQALLAWRRGGALAPAPPGAATRPPVGTPQSPRASRCAVIGSFCCGKPALYVSYASPIPFLSLSLTNLCWAVFILVFYGFLAL